MIAYVIEKYSKNFAFKPFLPQANDRITKLIKEYSDIFTTIKDFI